MILKTLRDITPYVRSVEYEVVQRSDRRSESSKPKPSMLPYRSRSTTSTKTTT